MAMFAASFIEQIIPKMSIAGGKYANGIIRDILRRSNQVTYLRPSNVTFSDEGFPYRGDNKRVSGIYCIFRKFYSSKNKTPETCINNIKKFRNSYCFLFYTLRAIPPDT